MIVVFLKICKEINRKQEEYETETVCGQQNLKYYGPLNRKCLLNFNFMKNCIFQGESIKLLLLSREVRVFAEVCGHTEQSEG